MNKTHAAGIAAAIGAFTLVLALLPMACAAWHDAHTAGFTPVYVAQNVADAGVYCAWIQQGAERHFLTRNLFAPGGPENHTVYLIFWMLGRLMALTKLSIGPFYGIVTVVSGGCLLVSLWWFVKLFVREPAQQLLAFSVTCLSSGIGWMFAMALGPNSDSLPIDFQQPEAVTFLSLRTPLFAFSQALMLLVVGNLWLAQRDRTWRPLVFAIPAVALLANSHTYDVLSLGAMWLVWLALSTLILKRFDRLAAWQALAVGLAAAIPGGINYVALKSTGVLAMRDAARTPAYPLWLDLAGFGFLLPLAVYGLVQGQVGARMNRPMLFGVALRRGLKPEIHPTLWMLATWFVVPLALQYLPDSFQRKLIMGVQVPLGLIAAVGLAGLVSRFRAPVRPVVLAAALAFLSISNLWIVRNELSDAVKPDAHPALLTSEFNALNWLRNHAEPDAVIQPMPKFTRSQTADDWDLEESTLDYLTPGYTGHSVACGHWGETPGFEKKMEEWQNFGEADTDDAWRMSLLRRYRVGYLVMSSVNCPESTDLGFGRWRASPPTFLRLVPSASDRAVQVYRVQIPAPGF